MENKNETSTDGNASGGSGSIKGAALLVYGILSSARMSGFLLFAMGLLFATAVIFRQGGPEQYLLDGDSLVFLARQPGLAALFTSPIFFVLYFALFVNLAVSLYARVRAIWSPMERFAPTGTISLTQNGAEAAADARRAFEDELGFRVRMRRTDWVVMEKGLPYSYLAWAHHAAVAVCLLGVALTFLFAFEQTATLTQGQPVAIDTAERGGSSSAVIRFVSGPFTAVYTERAEPIAPDSLLTRLASSLSYERLVCERRAGALYPIDWKMDITIADNGVAVMEKSIAPGAPLRYKGFNYYLNALDQTFRVRVDDNPLMLSVRNNDELVIPGIGRGLPVRFSIFRTGALIRGDGSVERINPHTRIRLSGKNSGGEELGMISPGESMYINGSRITLVKVVETAELAYRYDPGSALLRWGVILVLATMVLRLFGPFQMAAYRVDYSAPIVRLQLHIMSKGLFASTNRLSKKLERIMTSNDIRPIPLPGERLK